MKNRIRAVAGMLALAVSMQAGAQTCTADLTGNGIVDGADLGSMLAYWGPRTQDPYSIAADLDANGLINGADLGLLLSNWGPCASVISSISPSQGPVAGGTQVTITGTYLGSTTAVRFGDNLATNFTVVGANTVQAATPAGSVGPAAVRITTAAGVTTAPQAFNYYSATTPTWATLIEANPDPSVVTDPVLRAAISATGLAWRVRDTATQIEMMLIPPGTFQMGCIMPTNNHTCPAYEKPVHQVTLTNSFYIGRFEVTQSQWVAEMGSNPSYFQGQSDSASRPVETVSWNTIQGYLGATGLRLPTEAEWEYACRAGTQAPFYNGSVIEGTVGTLAWYSTNSGDQTHAVGGKAANGFGLYDMLGNVWEWVNDWYGTYPGSAQTNPTGPVSATGRVVRGGSWGNEPYDLRSSARYAGPPGNTYNLLGFRVARNP